MKKHSKNFNIFSSFSWFTPGWNGIIILSLWFLVGVFLGNVVSIIFSFAFGADIAADYGMLVAYPMMFLPPMMFASYKSKINSLFDDGYSLNSNHYGNAGAAVLGLCAIVSTLALSYVAEFLGNLLPDPPQWLMDIMAGLTEGKIWLNFLLVSLFAPFFEEWLCRGMVLRGLLNYKKKDGSNGIKPVWAIVVSAAFFAIIHGNPWQAVIAFSLGCLFGYIYYKTGSLWLTMLMHFANNTFALILGHIDSLKDMNSWRDVIDGPLYWIIYASCVLLVVLTVLVFRRIDTQSANGNCDRIAIIDN